ncbi:hypothetical protein Tco_0339313, partial [Tanacetum coccineum]
KLDTPYPMEVDTPYSAIDQNSVWKSVGYGISMYWIWHIGYFLEHGYAVSSLMDTSYWSSEQCNLANGNARLMLTVHEMVMYDLSLKLWDGDGNKCFRIAYILCICSVYRCPYLGGVATPGLWLQPSDLIYNLNPLIVLVVLIEAQYWVGMMERFSFAYAFSLVEAVMTLHGFHKDETICDIEAWIGDMYLGWETQKSTIMPVLQKNSKHKDKTSLRVVVGRHTRRNCEDLETKVDFCDFADVIHGASPAPTAPGGKYVPRFRRSEPSAQAPPPPAKSDRWGMRKKDDCAAPLSDKWRPRFSR